MSGAGLVQLPAKAFKPAQGGPWGPGCARR